jgi:regulatory protein
VDDQEHHVKRKITALKIQKRNPQRVNVYLDGEFALGLSRIVAAWLGVGQELDEGKIARLKAEDESEAAYQQALRFLNYRQRSESEVRRYLQRKDIPEAIAASVLERLHRSGLLDDVRFAQTWIENRSEFHPRSSRALGLELRQRGLDDTTIAQAVERVDEKAMAYLAGRKQAKKLHGLERLPFRQKLYAYLARRGFDYDIISSVVDRLWNEQLTGSSIDNS